MSEKYLWSFLIITCGCEEKSISYGTYKNVPKVSYVFFYSQNYNYCVLPAMFGWKCHIHMDFADWLSFQQLCLFLWKMKLQKMKMNSICILAEMTEQCKSLLYFVTSDNIPLTFVKFIMFRLVFIPKINRWRDRSEICNMEW